MLFKNPVRTSKRTPLFTITKINWLTLFKDVIALFSDNHAKFINTLYGQNVELLNIKTGGAYNYHSAFKV
jgi:hypothetical protein